MSAAGFDEDDRRAHLIDCIDRFGYTLILVGSGECSVPGCECVREPYPYAYSLGMVEHDHPELVTFGLPLCCANNMMQYVHAAAAVGTPLAIGREHRHDLGNGTSIALVDVPELWVRRDPGRIGCWLDIYAAQRGRVPPFVQICWSDLAGFMPWEPGCDPDVAAIQPLLADDPLRYPRPPRTRARPRRRR